MNYREAWANGEIEAGTLVDRIEEQAREIETLKAAVLVSQRSAVNIATELRSELSALKAKAIGVVSWLPIDTAPRDGSLVRLLVEFEDNATEDQEGPCPTIGANNYENDGEDVWLFAGWDWSHDLFTQGIGRAIGWLPLLENLNQPASAQEIDDLGFMTTKQWDFVYARFGVKAASAGDEREAFEREYLKANYPRVDSGELSAPPIFGRVGSLKFRGQSEGDYEDSDIQLCWAMWQARAALSANHGEQVPVAYVDDHYLDQLRRGRGFSIGVTPALHRRDGENNGLYTRPCAENEQLMGEMTKAKELLEECITTLYCQSSEGGEVLDRVNAFLAAAPSSGSQGGDV